jgi:hypothetical protein
MEYSNPNDYWRKQPDMYQGMSDDERMKAGCIQGLFYLAAVVIAFAVCALFGSCTTTKYVPIIEHHTDTLIQTNVQRDSIYVHDSISVTQKGDTIRIDRWHTKYVEKQVHDTTFVSKIDSIPQPYPVEVKVEKQLTWWQNFKLHLGGIVIWCALLVGVILLARWWLRQKKVI